MTEQFAPSRVPDWDVADRMRKALRDSGLHVQEIADYLGVSRGAVGNWINGKNAPKTQTLRLWALKTGVPFEWLQTGVVPPVTAPYPRLSAVGHHAPSLGVTLVGRELVPAA